MLDRFLSLAALTVGLLTVWVLLTVTCGRSAFWDARAAPLTSFLAAGR
jgi:hypothetical protein